MDIDDINPNRKNVVPAGETLDGEGKTLRTTSLIDPVIEVERGATVRNLEMVGPYIEHTRDGGWWDYEVSGTAWEFNSAAIGVVDSGATIENVTCRGWSHAGIIVGMGWGHGSGRHRDVTVRDCTLVDNNCRALGYGVVVLSGEPLIEWCDFQNNRHDVACDGSRESAYEVRYCHFGDTGRIYGTEVHPPGGDWVHVHHNTFEDKHGNTPRKGFGRKILIRNRGVPAQQCTVENNWFKGKMTVSMSSESRQKYTFRNNHEGPSEPPDGVGRPDRDEQTPAVDSTPPRLATKIPNRRSKAAACRGIVEAIEDSSN